MNRIFKVIWNKTTQRTEVVSELARGMAKSSSSSVVNTTKLVKPVLKLSLLSICLGYPTWAMAATGAENGAVKYGDYGIAIGGYNGGAQVGPKPKEGNRVAAVGNRQISIGHDKLVASGNNSIVIGSDYGHANAWGLTYRQGGTQGFNTVGIGAGAQSIGLNALALGAASGSGVGYQGYDDAVYLGSFSRIAPKGLGQNYTDAEINNLNNTYVTAVEAFNQNQNENTLNAVKEAGRKINNAALNKVEGMTIKSNVKHPSVEGKFTTQSEQVTQVNGSSGTTTVSILSVGGQDGNNTMYRQIQNVAAGRIASNSNDAVTGSQLYYVRNYTGWNIGHYDDATKANTTTGRVNNDHTVIFKPGEYTDVYTTLDSTNQSTVGIEVKTASLTTEIANGKISKVLITEPVGTDASKTVAKTAGVKSVLEDFNKIKADKVDIMGYSHVNETDADKVTENRIITAKDWDRQFDDNSGTYHESAGAKGNRAITSGVRANALANDSIAIGSLANVNNNWGGQLVAAERSIAIGREATVNAGKDSIAMGSGAQILHNDSTTLNANNSIAIGNLSKIDQASNAIALGNKASVGGNYASGGVWKASDNSIAIGNETTVSRENSVGIGTNVSVARENSVVIGQNAKGELERVVAIGAHAVAKGDRTVAIGPEATANGSRSIVIGGIGDAKATAEKDYSIVIGNGAQATDNATYSVTLGNNAKTAGATGISIGDRAQVVASATNGIALGQSAVANNSGDIAIGQSSSTSTKHTVSDIKIGDATLSKGVAATDNGTVSFGKDNVKRQIQNVGAGEISATSSDVITGSQLYYVIKAADEIAKTEYTFKVNGVDKKIMRNNGTSTTNNTNNTLDFRAGDGLEVAYENNAVTYKLNADSNKAITDAKNAATTVTNSLQEINRSVARAETAASAASTSASAARSSATAASTSASAASTSASAARSSATAASTSASAASSSATAASTSASAANSSATAASTSASAANSSATAASTSASAANSSATAASTSASAANSSATAASTSASAANSSATAASTSASAANSSATAASTSASAAGSSATAASTSASAANSSATAASTSASAANSSATAASTSASAANSSATAASTSASAANSSATAASTSASAANSSATAASTSASAAGSSATAAASSATAAESSAKRIDDSGLISKDGKTAFAADNTSKRDSAKAKGKDATAIGYGANASDENSTALGNNSQASGENSTAVGQDAKATANNSVALGKGSVANEANTVSVGSQGNERRVTNVADPIRSTDAANKQYVDRSVGAVDKKLRGGIAGATAIANIPQVTKPGGLVLGLGVGNYRGQSAVAVGYSRASDNNRVIFKMSGAVTTQGDYNVGAGVGYQW